MAGELRTNWVGPGRGEVVRDLCAWAGIPVPRMRGDWITDLKVLWPTASPDPYDVERAKEAVTTRHSKPPREPLP